MSQQLKFCVLMSLNELQYYLSLLTHHTRQVCEGVEKMLTPADGKWVRSTFYPLPFTSC